ncbi:EF-hand domain-containing protein [Allokutzneria oryzae]|uniref:EF-hand domain-containing protein n=1 Tax=Allokutzneria oryzae TaxID=1378989 RepID=A0ABV6A3Q3_9PSEU
MTTTGPDTINARYARTFDALDANKDGHLEWPDYQTLIDRYLAAYGLDKNDRRSRALHACYQMQWMELLRHAGVKGDRLTKDEFVAATRQASLDTSRLNVVEGGSHAIFDVVDADEDNEITGDEFARLLADVWKVTSLEAMETFDQLDSDGDGCISRQEFIRAVREYYYADDPDAPGAVFFGGA